MGQIIVERASIARERAAVSALFFVNGYVVGSWAPRIPSFKAELGIDEGVLGLLILAIGAGSLVAMPLAAMAMARDGSRRTACLSGLALAPMLALLTLPSDLFFAALLLGLFGGLVGGMDVAANTNAAAVERRAGRPIMSSCHGWWSAGGLMGAAVGGPLLAGSGPVGHAAVVAGVSIVLVGAAMPMMLRDRPEREGRPQSAATAGRRRMLLPLLIGGIALFGVIPEGAVLDWSALYLRQEHGASVEVMGLAFAAFSAAMAGMRFAGDRIRRAIGATRALQLSCLAAAAGLMVASSSDGIALTVAGFALTGCGIANLVPIAFAAASGLPGIAPGTALTIASFLAYSGLLFAPSLIGFVAERTGLGPVYLALPVLLAGALGLSGLARHADPIAK